MIDTLLLRLLVLYFVRRLLGWLLGYTKQKLQPNQHADAHTIQYDTSPEIAAQNLLIPAEGNLPSDPSNDIIKFQDTFFSI
jgi:hypothetical protein